VSVAPASSVDREALDQLLQLYQYDFSEIEGGTIGDDGRYHYLNATSWIDHANRHAFLIRVDREIAGFALVELGAEKLVHSFERRPHEATPSLEEFFILRKFRRSGIGRRAAYDVFDRFPGRWQLSQTANNRVAHTFWLKVIDDYTGGQFEERSDPADQWCTTWQTFRSPGVERAPRNLT